MSPFWFPLSLFRTFFIDGSSDPLFFSPSENRDQWPRQFVFRDDKSWFGSKYRELLATSSCCRWSSRHFVRFRSRTWINLCTHSLIQSLCRYKVNVITFDEKIEVNLQITHYFAIVRRALILLNFSQLDFQLHFCKLSYPRRVAGASRCRTRFIHFLTKCLGLHKLKIKSKKYENADCSINGDESNGNKRKDKN